MDRGNPGECAVVGRPTPSRLAVIAALEASGRLSPDTAAELVRDGRVDDVAWARVRPLYALQQREMLEQQVREVEGHCPENEDEALHRINQAIAALAQSDDPYDAANAIAAAASDGLDLSSTACDHSPLSVAAA